jgi:hypothetical protein
VIRYALAVLAFGLALGGCKKNIQTNEAVRQALLNHLANNKGLNVASMDIDIQQLTFRENEADVLVGFAPKGEGAANSMRMQYTLERKGNQWVVKQRSDSGGMGAHGAAAPPEGETALPPGHPPAGGGGMPPAPQK